MRVRTRPRVRPRRRDRGRRRRNELVGVAAPHREVVPGVSRPTTPGIAASTRCRWQPGRRRPWRAIGATKTMHADFGSGLWDGGPIGIPITVVGKGQREERRPLRVRRRVRPRAVPDPGRRQDRGRRRLGRRPPRPDRRPRCVQALRALRAAPGRRPLDGRIGRDLEPALEPRPPRRLDVGRRRRARRSCRASPATTRWRRAGSTTPSASPSPARVAPTSGRRATSRARSPTRRCRRWELASA